MSANMWWLIIGGVVLAVPVGFMFRPRLGPGRPWTLGTVAPPIPTIGANGLPLDVTTGRSPRMVAIEYEVGDEPESGVEFQMVAGDEPGRGYDRITSALTAMGSDAAPPGGWEDRVVSSVRAARRKGGRP